jgi:hypothetical protein
MFICTVINKTEEHIQYHYMDINISDFLFRFPQRHMKCYTDLDKGMNRLEVIEIGISKLYGTTSNLMPNITSTNV